MCVCLFFSVARFLVRLYVMDLLTRLTKLFLEPITVWEMKINCTNMEDEDESEDDPDDIEPKRLDESTKNLSFEIVPFVSIHGNEGICETKDNHEKWGFEVTQKSVYWVQPLKGPAIMRLPVYHHVICKASYVYLLVKCDGGENCGWMISYRTHQDVYELLGGTEKNVVMSDLTKFVRLVWFQSDGLIQLQSFQFKSTDFNVAVLVWDVKDDVSFYQLANQSISREWIHTYQPVDSKLEVHTLTGMITRPLLQVSEVLNHTDYRFLGYRRVDYISGPEKQNNNNDSLGIPFEQIHEWSAKNNEESLLRCLAQIVHQLRQFCRRNDPRKKFVQKLVVDKNLQGIDGNTSSIASFQCFLQQSAKEAYDTSSQDKSSNEVYRKFALRFHKKTMERISPLDESFSNHPKPFTRASWSEEKKSVLQALEAHAQTLQNIIAASLPPSSSEIQSFLSWFTFLLGVRVIVMDNIRPPLCVDLSIRDQFDRQIVQQVYLVRSGKGSSPHYNLIQYMTCGKGKSWRKKPTCFFPIETCPSARRAQTMYVSSHIVPDITKSGERGIDFVARFYPLYKQPLRFERKHIESGKPLVQAELPKLEYKDTELILGVMCNYADRLSCIYTTLTQTLPTEGEWKGMEPYLVPRILYYQRLVLAAYKRQKEQNNDPGVLREINRMDSIWSKDPDDDSVRAFFVDLKSNLHLDQKAAYDQVQKTQRSRNNDFPVPIGVFLTEYFAGDQVAAMEFFFSFNAATRNMYETHQQLSRAEFMAMLIKGMMNTHHDQINDLQVRNKPRYRAAASSMLLEIEKLAAALSVDVMTVLLHVVKRCEEEIELRYVIEDKVTTDQEKIDQTIEIWKKIPNTIMHEHKKARNITEAQISVPILGYRGEPRWNPLISQEDDIHSSMYQNNLLFDFQIQLSAISTHFIPWLVENVNILVQRTDNMNIFVHSHEEATQGPTFRVRARIPLTDKMVSEQGNNIHDIIQELKLKPCWLSTELDNHVTLVRKS